MSLSPAVVWEVRTTGSDANGGGFVAGSSGTDYSQQSAAQVAVADAVTNGTTTITSATANFDSTHVGNLISISGGTGSIAADWYQVNSVTDAATIVVDRSTGLTAGTGATLNLGGALATPGGAAAASTNNTQTIWVQSGTYNLATATPGPGGPLASSGGLTIEGYDQSRGDRTANRPTISWASVAAPGALTYLIQAAGTSRSVAANLVLDGNNVANVGGIHPGLTRATYIDCVAQNFGGSGAIGFFLGSSPCYALRCRASNCTTGYSVNNGAGDGCEALDCTTGFAGSGQFLNCLARGCTTGFACSATGDLLSRCTADSNTTGFSGGSSLTYSGCLATNQSGTGGIGFSLGGNASLYNCAAYNNLATLSGSTPLVNRGFVTLSADPYVSQATGDFRPNANNPGGAQLRGAGIGVYGQADNADIGAVQHPDPTGGGTTNIISRRRYARI